MSSLTIVPPQVAPLPRPTPGSVVVAPASVRPTDVPRPHVVVQLSEQVREPTETEKQDADDRKRRLQRKDTKDPDELSADQQREVRDLQKTDRKVRSHEAAHKAVAGAYARSAAQFVTVVGPDGKRYATGGEVAIDASPVPGDPEATVRKMDQVARAALAPADPSPQDRAVAAQARQAGAEAQREASREPRQPAGEASRTPSANDSTATDAHALHGHPPGASCPLCTALGTAPVRQHGSLDLSA